MEWYLWVLIGIAAIGIATLKLKFLGKWMENRKKRETQFKDED